MFQKWGQNKSFKGKWSNGSDKWNKVTDELKDLSPSFLQEELKFMNDRIYYYYDEINSKN